MSDKKDKNQEAEINDEKLEKRRKALKSILAGSGTVVTAAAMQDKWAKPVIESVVLPAHAQTSGASGASFVLSNSNTQNGSDLLDTLVPRAMADCTPQICVNIPNVIAGGLVTAETIENGKPGKGTGKLVKGDGDNKFTFNIQLEGTRSNISGVVTGEPGSRVLNGAISGGGCDGSYGPIPESTGVCSFDGRTTTTYNPSTTTSDPV